MSDRLLPFLALLLALLAGPPLQAAPSQDELIRLGERLYREGLDVDGQPVQARRAGLAVEGAAAACIQCHRRSGLGGVEGSNAMPPITGRYLFERDPRAVVQQNLRGTKAFSQSHAPYDEAGAAAAIRLGRHVSGRSLDALMPRYPLDERSMTALLAYLRQLSAERSPGVSEHHLRLASVITPDLDPARRASFIATVRAAVQQKNGSVVQGGRSMASAAGMLLRTERQWQHEFWPLQGPPETWDAQLREHYARNPVFALVSGLGGSTWAPVHRFCEQQALPCWFPSLNAPPEQAGQDHYSVYFSRGLGVETDVLLQHWQQGGERPRRLVQVQGRQAVPALMTTLEQALGVPAERLDAAQLPVEQLAQRLAGLGADTALVLWLDQAEADRLGAALATQAAAPGRALWYWSGVLLGAQAPALPPAWLAQSRSLYPYQLPAQRQLALSYFHQWLQIARLPLVDEVLQSEVYFALSFFNDVQIEMLDNLQRDYLLDRAEAMLSLRERSRAEDELREASLVALNRRGNTGMQRPLAERQIATRPLPGRVLRADVRHDAPDQLLRVEGTTVYPRLSLAPGQRLASKGAYLVRHPDAGRIEAVSDWIVP